MVTTLPTGGPVVAPADERPALAELDALLDEREAGAIALVNARGVRIDLPETALRPLHDVVRGLVRDRPVAVVTLARELSIQRAADLLDAPPAHVVQLLDEGELPFIGTAARRRIRFEDLMAHKARRDEGRRRGLAGLTRTSQEMGLYDGDDRPG